MTSYVFQVDDFALYRYFTGRYQTVRCAKVTCVRVQCPGRIQIGARHPPPPPVVQAWPQVPGTEGGTGTECHQPLPADHPLLDCQVSQG